MEIGLHILSDQHLEKILEWRNSDLIRNVSFNKAIISLQEHEKWFERAKSDKSQLHWIVTINGTDAGYASIKNIDVENKRCEFASLYIGEENFLLSGAGALIEYKIINYMYDNYSYLNKIHCEVLGSNTKVIKLHKRFGFVVEGELQQHYFVKNEFDSVVLLALFRDNWIQSKIALERILIK